MSANGRMWTVWLASCSAIEASVMRPIGMLGG